MKAKVCVLWKWCWLMWLFAVAPVWAQSPPTTLISTGAVWKYLADGSAQGTAWTLPGFDDSAWPAGPAQLGYGDGDEATIIPFGTNSFDRHVTYYFRRALTVTNVGGFTNLLGRLLRDDGAIVYLNGVEVFRSNLPEGYVDHRTLASAIVEDPAGTYYPVLIPRGLLTNGTNVVAAEVHQVATTSTDVSFDFELLGYANTNLGPPQLVRPPRSHSIVRGGRVQLEATALGALPLSFQWLRGTNVSATVPTSSNDVFHTTTVLSTPATNYTLIVTNSLGSTSATVTITALIDADGDRVADTWEAAYGFATNNVTDATADSDGDDQVNRSEFVAGTNPTNAASFFQALPVQTIASRGDKVVLGALATNTAPLLYQWFRNGVAIPGARGSSLALFDVQINQAGLYTVTASNYSGAVTSTAARLDVVGPATVTMVAGWQLIANQFNRGSNSLDEIMPVVPVGSVVYKFRGDLQQWEEPSEYLGGTGWLPKGLQLNPGEGAYFYSLSNFSLTLSGSTPTPALPLLLPAGCSLVSRQVALPGDFESIVGRSPNRGEEVRRWSAAQQMEVRYSYDEDLGGWMPGPPTAAIGEAWWICGVSASQSNAAPYIGPIPAQTVQAGVTSAPVTFTVIDRETPAGSLVVQARSANENILASSGLFLVRRGNLWDLTIAPGALQSGTTDVTVSASDGAATRTRVFTVNVLPQPLVCCRGFLLREIYTNITGNVSLTNLKQNAAFPNQPARSDYLTNFTSPQLETNSGARIRGVVIPAVTGAYRFRLSAVHAGELALSSDDSPANLNLIASRDTCCGAVESSDIVLTAGRRYFVQALSRATNTPNSLVVDWRLPGLGSFSAIRADRIAALSLPGASNTLVVLVSPADVTVASGAPATFRVAVQSTFPIVFHQWQRRVGTNFVDLPGANSTNYVIPAAIAADQGAYRCVVSVPGRCLETGSGVLTVTPNPTDCATDTVGTNFWLTIPGNASPDLGAVTQPYLSIVGGNGTAGEVLIPGLGLSTAFAIGSEGVARVILTNNADLGNALETVEPKGVRVIAQRPVRVFVVNDLEFTTDAFMVTPMEMLGQDHVVMAYGNNHEDLPSLNGSQLALVATRPDTSVTFELSTAVGAHPAAVPWTVRLQEGETFQLRATNNGSADLTGSRVIADKPIALFAGHQCATIPSSNVFFCNYVAEQVPPTAALGTSFYVVPFLGRTNYTIRCAVPLDGTSIRVGGVSAGSFNRGTFLEFQRSNAVAIVSTKPIAVAQFGHSADDDGAVAADPTMITLLSRERWVTNVAIDSVLRFTNHLNVVVQDAPGVSVSIDGVVLPLSSAADGVRFAQKAVTPGRHQLTSSQPMQVTVHGYSQNRYDAYGYLAGARLPQLIPPTVTGPTSVVVSAGTQCGTNVPVVTVTGMVSCASAGPLVIRQEPAPGVHLDAGTYFVTNTVTDALGASAQWVTRLVIQDLRRGGIVVPTNLVVECTNHLGSVVDFPVTATNACGNTVPVVCSPPSGGVFALGTTVVICRVNDPSSLAVTNTFTVAVVDRTPPIISCPSNRVVPTTNAAGTVVGYNVAATDACDPVVVVVCSPPSGTAFPLGQSNVTCTATDDSGHQAVCSFVVAVAPPAVVLQPPVLTAGTLRLSFNTIAGLPYVVEYKTNLNTGTWTVLTNVVGNGEAARVTEAIPPGRSGRFYRVRR